jgi:uncharacterized protein (DUF1778 family)
MRPKLNGLSLTFRLSEEQSEIVERAMRVQKTSNTSEFVRRTLLLECERILEEHELLLMRRAALRAEIEQAEPPSLGLVAESPAPYHASAPAEGQKKAREPGAVPRARTAG